MPTELKTRVKPLENVKIVSINNQNPINFMDGLALLFIGLKLTEHLQDWTWVEVLAPLWGPLMVSWFLRLVIRTFGGSEEEE